MKDAEFKVNGAVIGIKPARSKLNGKRNVSIRKAEELIKAHDEGQDKDVKIEWKTAVPGVRTVTVGDVIAFSQSKNDVGGTFSAPFDGLALP